MIKMLCVQSYEIFFNYRALMALNLTKAGEDAPFVILARLYLIIYIIGAYFFASAGFFAAGFLAAGLTFGRAHTGSVPL